MHDVIDQVCRVKSLTRDEGQVLRPKGRFIKHLMNTEYGMTPKKALKIWKERKKTGYSEWKNGELCVAMEKDIELNNKDGIEVRKGKHLKQGDDCRAAMASLAHDLKGFSADGSKALMSIVGSESKASKRDGKRARDKRAKPGRKSRSRSRSSRRGGKNSRGGARKKFDSSSSDSSLPDEDVDVPSAMGSSSGVESVEEVSAPRQRRSRGKDRGGERHGVAHMLKIICICFDPP